MFSTSTLSTGTTPMNSPQKIKRALISVSDKTGLLPLATALTQLNIEIISTGGTADMLRNMKIPVIDVSTLTNMPEMMDGRVKTLHPGVHGGLLALREHSEHLSQMQQHGIAPIDLLIVNLYPFEATIARDATAEAAIEQIDIGGPAMIRSGAKNHAYVTVITDPHDYPLLQEELNINQGHTTLSFRQIMASKAFARTGMYDAAISQWFSKQLGTECPEKLVIGASRLHTLRYGENPHQRAALYITSTSSVTIATAEQIQGKELSYNNIYDADAALMLVSEFEQPAAAIIKHANPCGAAIGDTIADAYIKAYASDPISAFGGIVALNRPLNAETARHIEKLFVEVVVAPEADDEARQILSAKKNMRLLITHALPDTKTARWQLKSITGGFLMQEEDIQLIDKNQYKTVSKRQPTDSEIADLLFAFTVCKHVRSNAIVFAKSGQTIGIGAGQMSRVDAVRMASWKSIDPQNQQQRAIGAVMASDAFFPFADGLLLAQQAGITSAIHPGGSVRDAEVIAAGDEHNMAMIITGIRHFKH
jgi:phosphoribosylaminoimidazolecarboxamide formyltransferase/IMP cyclohydrolase